jgi:predicted ATP-dependent serine protease
MTTMPVVYCYDEIPSIPVERISIGIEPLDNILSGLVRGKISIWSGAKGTGKTRLWSHIITKLNAQGMSALIIENEAPPDEFRQWVGDTITYPKKLFVADTRDCKDLCTMIRKYRPDVVLVDSFSMMKGVKRENSVEQVMMDLRDAARVTNAHIALVCHQTKAGDTRGPNSIGHLCDVEVFLTKCIVPTLKQMILSVADEYQISVNATVRRLARERIKGVEPGFKGCFKVGVGKNRYGPSDGYAIFRHRGSGGPELVYPSAK